MLNRKILKLIFPYKFVMNSSQTIYELLRGCVILANFNRAKWDPRVRNLTKLLIEIQKNDGGFDIGYDFYFGLLHKRGESTTPESIANIALYESWKYLSDNPSDDCLLIQTENSIFKCGEWLLKHSNKTSDGFHYIPYAPYSSNSLIVINAMSFAAGALVPYLMIENGKKNKNANELLFGLIYHIEKKLISSRNLKGKIWPYWDEKWDNLSEFMKNKIDYYHAAQQLEVHCFIHEYYKIEENYKIILNVYNHLLALSENFHPIPYCNNPEYFNGLIHVWGYSSIIPALISANRILERDVKEIDLIINNTIDWLLNYSLKKNYFIPVLTSEGQAFDDDVYVRSDAWVFHALSTTNKQYSDIESILDAVYLNIESRNFSGKDNHASSNFYRNIRNLKNRIIKRNYK